MKELTFSNVINSFSRLAKDYAEFSNSNGGPFWAQSIERALTVGKESSVLCGLHITNVIDKQAYYIVQFTVGVWMKKQSISKSFWIRK